MAALSAIVAAVLQAQDGTTPKASAADYPAHSSATTLSLGAEYMIHSFSGGRQTFIAKGYLVVEVALYPAKGERLIVDASHFSLRLNGKKQTLSPQAPEFVAASLKYPDWETQRQVEVAAGPIILGRPRSVERFPGDPEARQRVPNPPRPPTIDDPSGQDKAPPVTADHLAMQTALAEGEAHGPVSGYLYFAYSGKTQRIRTLDLDYSGPAGNAILPLL